MSSCYGQRYALESGKGYDIDGGYIQEDVNPKGAYNMDVLPSETQGLTGAPPNAGYDTSSKSGPIKFISKSVARTGQLVTLLLIMSAATFALVVVPMFSNIVGKKNFGYTGEIAPQHWGELNSAWKMCEPGRGIAQSPINLPVAAAGYKTGPEYKGNPLDFVHLEPALFTISQNNGLPNYSCIELGRCGKLVLPDRDDPSKSAVYRMIDMHLHAPGEHQIDGMTYAMELHIKFCTGQCVVGKDYYTVLAILYDGSMDPNAEDDAGTAALRDMFAPNNINAAKGSVNLDLNDIVDLKSGYYSYHGSLTTPPCIEGIEFIIQSRIVHTKQAVLDTFISRIDFPGNARPVQPINGREIQYNVPKASNSIFGR